MDTQKIFISRRQVLKATFATGALLPIGYVAGVSFGDYPERSGLRVLSSKEAAILEAIAETIVPPSETQGFSVKEVNFVARTDEWLGIMPNENQEQIKFLLWATEHMVPLRCFYFRKFTRLSPESRFNLINRFSLSVSPAQRGLARALKSLVGLMYYTHPLVVPAFDPIPRCGE